MISMLKGVQKGNNFKYIYGKLLVVVVSNIVAVHHYILFLYFILTITLQLIE